MFRYRNVLVISLLYMGCSTLRPDSGVQDALLTQYAQTHAQLSEARALYEAKKASLSPADQAQLAAAIEDAEFLLHEADRLAASDSPDLTTAQAMLLKDKAVRLHGSVKVIVDKNRDSLTPEQQMELARLTSALDRLDYYFQQVREQQKDWKATKKEAVGITLEIIKGVAGLLL